VGAAKRREVAGTKNTHDSFSWKVRDRTLGNLAQAASSDGAKKPTSRREGKPVAIARPLAKKTKAVKP